MAFCTETQGFDALRQRFDRIVAGTCACHLALLPVGNGISPHQDLQYCGKQPVANARMEDDGGYLHHAINRRIDLPSHCSVADIPCWSSYGVVGLYAQTRYPGAA